MPDTKKLTKFNVEEADDGFSLHIEDESGDILELAATREQLDLIADTLDDILSATEEADEVEGDKEESDDED